MGVVGIGVLEVDGIAYGPGKDRFSCGVLYDVVDPNEQL